MLCVFLHRAFNYRDLTADKSGELALDAFFVAFIFGHGSLPWLGELSGNRSLKQIK